MRLWSIHPQYLDPQGLVALWREGLLARAVLHGATRGYRHHPQLERFQAQRQPSAAINAYLFDVHDESVVRGYSFDRRKLSRVRSRVRLTVTTGQLAHEWQHLLSKLKNRSPSLIKRFRRISTPLPHPLFEIIEGPIAPWERP